MRSGERSRSNYANWRSVFAVAIAVRPVLVVPMAPSGPAAGTILLPIGLAALFIVSVLIAAGVFVGNRLMVAFGIFTALDGVLLAVAGMGLGLPMPWPLALCLYNVALCAIGVEAWRETRVADGGRAASQSGCNPPR